MRQQEVWKPTKFELHKGAWRASRDAREVGHGSRLTADRSVNAYSAALREHARGRLLDVGCGKVPLYGCYRDLVTDVTCVDWPSSLHSSPHLDLEADLGEPLPLGDAEFDTILATDVLEHLPYPDVLWGEIRRLLRPGGKVIVGVPFMYWLHERPHDHHRYTEYRLRLFCADHKLTVRQCAPYGGGVDVLADLASKMLDRTGVRVVLPALAWAARRTGTVKHTTAFPLGYLLVAEREIE